MKRNHRHRPLAYEQLESKAAPSSILMVVSGDRPHTDRIVVARSSLATDSALVSACRYETEQILRFVAENTTGGRHVDRPSPLPTAAQCAAADAMMKLVPTEWNSFLVLGFYGDGTEL